LYFLNRLWGGHLARRLWGGRLWGGHLARPDYIIPPHLARPDYIIPPHLACRLWGGHLAGCGVGILPALIILYPHQILLSGYLACPMI